MAGYTLDTSGDHCAECAGFGFFPTSTTKNGAGFTMCLKCAGKATRTAGSADWEPGTRRLLTMQWRGYKRDGYVWHFKCLSCGTRHLDCITFKENKEAGRLPCCGDKMQLVVHSPHAVECDCVIGFQPGVR